MKYFLSPTSTSSRIVFAAMMAALILAGCETMVENYRQTYCNYDGAYKKGMNDARGGAQMDTDVSAACDEGTKPAVERGYREGYTSYLRSQPRHIEVHVDNPMQIPMPPLPPSDCESNIDCKGTRWCRDIGRGVHRCLGEEPRGGFCQTSSDCDTSLFCRDAENGFKRCR